MKRRSGFAVMAKLIGLVRPLAGFMVLAVAMGLAGHLCAAFLTIFGAWAVLSVLGLPAPMGLGALFACAAAFAVLRALLRYGEQGCNHYIAFKLLALIRDRVFRALRRLCPAKLEGRDKGDLISVITSDIELLEVFYAHTISPIAIAVLFCGGMCLFIGQYHWLLGLLALAAYLAVGVAVPLVTSRLSGDDGMRLRTKSGELSAFVLDSLRGLPEIQQYGRGADRLAEMDRRTAALAKDEERMKRTAGRNTAVTNTCILLFDLAMLFASAWLMGRQAVGFDGVLVPTVALMSSFGPAVALAGLGSMLQNTFAAGNRVLDILEEEPAVQEIAGRPGTSFSGAAARHVGFAYGREEVLRDVSVDIPQGQVVGIVGAQRQRQIHAAQAVHAVLAGAAGPGDGLRPGRERRQHRRSARDGELCHPGDPPVPRQHQEQPAHRPAGRHRRADRRGLQKGVHPRLYPGAAPRLRHPGGRAGRHAVRRRAAAAGPGAGVFA